jgi:hypothetical protein
MQPEVVITESELPAEVVQAIADGRKIEAIKMLREATGIGLANAKVLVDRAARAHGPRKSIPSSPLTEDVGNGKFLVSLVGAILLGVAYYLYTTT